MNGDKTLRAEQRICDAVLLLESVDVCDLPKQYRERFEQLNAGLCDLWGEMDEDLFPLGEEKE